MIAEPVPSLVDYDSWTGFPRFSARSPWRGDAPASRAMGDAARKSWEAASGRAGGPPEGVGKPIGSEQDYVDPRRYARSGFLISSNLRLKCA